MKRILAIFLILAALLSLSACSSSNNSSVSTEQKSTNSSSSTPSHLGKWHSSFPLGGIESYILFEIDVELLDNGTYTWACENATVNKQHPYFKEMLENVGSESAFMELLEEEIQEVDQIFDEGEIPKYTLVSTPNALSEPFEHFYYDKNSDLLQMLADGGLIVEFTRQK